MKVLYFHQYFKTRDSFGGTRSYEFARYLVERGHSVTMVYAHTNNRKSPLSGPFIKGVRKGSYEGIELIELNLDYTQKFSKIKRAWVFLKFAIKSLKPVFSEDYDVLFATSTPLTAGIPGIVMKWFRKKTFIFEVRDLWPELPREMGVITNPFLLKLMDILEYQSYKSADAHIALSPGIKNGIQKKGIKEEKITVIPNGCDINTFKPGNKSKSIFGVSDDDLVAVFTGTHGIANGVDAALDAAAELKIQKENKIKLVFIGDGLKKKELIDRAKRENLSNCIFIEPVSKNQMAEYLKAADIGMMLLSNIPSFYYGTSPNKFFDYIAAGVPVLNNYPGWLAELIIEYQCGTVVNPDNPKEFAEALINYEVNREKLKSEGINSRKLAIEKFDINKLADDFANELEINISN